MPNYRELLQQVKSEIDEVDVTQARELLDAPERPLVVDVRELDEWTEGRIPGAIHIPRGNLESRPIDLPLLRRRQPLGLRREVARGARLRKRRLPRRRLHRLEAQRPPDRAAAHARRREAAALQPACPDPGGRRGGTAKAARLARAAARRRWAR